MESDSRSDDAYGRELRRLLEATIRAELAVASGIKGIQLADETLERFACAVATQVDYGFRYRWNPEWTPPGQPHTWVDGDQLYARPPLR